LKELSTGCFTKKRLLEDIGAVEKATKELLAKDAKAAAARRRGAPGFGPPGGMFGAGGPALRAFAEKRTASVAAQLAGKSRGSAPRCSSGRPGGGRGPPQPIAEKTFPEVAQAPAEFEVTLSGAPPQVNYPVAIAATPTGEVFIAVDEQGSLGRTKGGGRVLR